MDRSFEELYRGHRADVFRAALRELGNVHDAEDVTQAAFADAYRAVLRGTRPESPRAWLLAIAENVRRRRYRTVQRRPREEPLEAEFPVSAELSHEHAHALAEALGDLSAEQRRVFVLRELGGLSYEEIADETGATVAAIQMQLFRARQALRERLEPPTVARRRTGVLVPLPGWLTGLFTRTDVTLLTPRAAGAVGAAVAVVGASVVVGDVGVDAPRAAAEPRQPIVTTAGADGRAAGREARPAAASRLRASATATSTRVPVLGRRSASTKQARHETQVAAPETTPGAAPVSPEPLAPAAQASPRSAAPPPPEPVQTVTERVTEVVAAPVETVETVERVLEPPRLPVALVDEEAEHLLEPPGTPPLPTAPLTEAVTGAARAAGDGAPPLPVPGVPPPALPPVP